ncbi:hypothetical protein LCGC14_0623800 [marine sediment metagenome]|uniref:Uncharacterized protein n=1 Tax=marine sediment metagenome TaxID=412755 RepID=A0A0F9R939_9ZZZZ
MPYNRVNSASWGIVALCLLDAYLDIAVGSTCYPFAHSGRQPQAKLE